jgi:hypothetical protein
MTPIRTLIIRLILLSGLWLAIPAVPVHAEFCDDVCFPTCQEWEENCVADGGECGTLCSCDYIYQRCNMCACDYPI